MFTLYDGPMLGSPSAPPTLLALPLEILDLITKQLTTRDLWSVYDCCQHLRVCAARWLFRKVTIRFDGSTPFMLNGRFLRPPRSDLVQTLSRWSDHVRTLDIWGDEAVLPDKFLGFLGDMHRLQTPVGTLSVDFMSPSIWQLQVTFVHLRCLRLSCIEHEPGLFVVPSLPALERLCLDFCCYCLDCPQAGLGPCAELQFDRLPSLTSLSISGARQESIVCSGSAFDLRRVEITFSTDIDWQSLCPALGCHLEELVITNCDFVARRQRYQPHWPNLQSLRIYDSSTAVALLESVELPAGVHVRVRMQPTDLQHLSTWPMVLQALSAVCVTVSFSSHQNLPHALLLRLQQLTSLRTVQIDKTDCTWVAACLSDLNAAGDRAEDVQSSELETAG
ncbi:hypothetical protein BO82DRAFT_409798 [Aspergillus uvarum CBS 121591]|uniref:F-box domain-containing protein n=1 Tax=Aspergillus uvarum CBS 121591 TaxID=1448315 RepID=A0A319BQ90_9EURO|nr:hypothetical protein BO82DRAFT_409798 [Aspergillus uvarum CBS 121591]PYH75606.1 hypothetical protein BO82DRAFT_409798 [Aspergillus uvarum CBS 121591]